MQPKRLLQRRRGRSIAAQFFHSLSVTAARGSVLTFFANTNPKKVRTDPRAAVTDHYDLGRIPYCSDWPFYSLSLLCSHPQTTIPPLIRQRSNPIPHSTSLLPTKISRPASRPSAPLISSPSNSKTNA